MTQSHEDFEDIITESNRIGSNQIEQNGLFGFVRTNRAVTSCQSYMQLRNYCQRA
jgi:hypothetical protein